MGKKMLEDLMRGWRSLKNKNFCMKKVIVASKNPVKINATRNAFKKMFPNDLFEVEGISVSSGVSDQPLDESETILGALNRADNACREDSTADFYVGLEGGIKKNDSDMEAFAWCAIKSKEGLLGKGRTGSYFLPPKIVELIQQGKELGEADDIVFGRINSKQENGAVGILTNNVIDRTTYYTGAAILALIPFTNKDLYR